MQPGCVGMQHSVKSLKDTTVLSLCNSDPRRRSMHLGLQALLDAFSMPQIQRVALATANKHMVCGRKMVLCGQEKQNKTPPWPPSEVAGGEQCWSRVYDSLGLGVRCSAFGPIASNLNHLLKKWRKRC